jgi:hypothetical protein
VLKRAFFFPIGTLMSPEGIDPSSLESPKEKHGAAPGQDRPGPRAAIGPRKSRLRFRQIWMTATPYFLSAVLFLSGFFSVFAPLPLLVQRYVGAALLIRVGAWLTNGGVVLAFGGPGAFVVYGVLVLPVVWFLPLLFERTRKPETAILATWLAILGASVLAVSVSSWQAGQAPWQDVRQAVDTVLNQVYEELPMDRRSMGELTREEWMSGVRRELPWQVVTLALFWVFANGMILLRWNPRHLRERLGLESRFFATWKAPEVLIVPVIVLGAMAVFGKGLVSDIGLNGVYTLMAIYTIQGLSNVSFLLDLWGLHGPLRSIVYAVGLLVMLPLILAIGFFDTWFDFRARLRQR